MRIEEVASPQAGQLALPAPQPASQAAVGAPGAQPTPTEQLQMTAPTSQAASAQQGSSTEELEVVAHTAESRTSRL